jgi:hypothetical protein
MLSGIGLRSDEDVARYKPALALRTHESVAAAAESLLKFDAVALEAKAMSKAKANPQWALKTAAAADAIRKVSIPDVKRGATPESVEVALAQKAELLQKLVVEIEQ